MNSGTIPPPFIKQSDGTTIFNDGTNTFSDGAIKYFNGVTSFPDGSLFYADGSQLSGPNPHIALYHQTQLQQYYDFEHGLNNQYTLPRVPGYIAPMNPTVNVQGIVESYAPNPGMPQFTALPPTQTLKPMPGFMPLPDYTPVTGYMPLPSHPMAPPQNAGPLQPYQPPPPFVPQAVQDEAKKADSPELNSEHVDSHSGDYLSESTPRRITRKPSVAGSSTAALAANAISFRAQESKTETTGQIPDSAPAEDEPKPEPKPKPNPRLFAKATSPERQAAPESTKASVAPWAAQAQTTKVGRRIPVHHDTITGPVRAYVKNVKESVDANELEAYLDKFGGLVYFDVSRKKVCLIPPLPLLLRL
jgi:hypothetical protein